MASQFSVGEKVFSINQRHHPGLPGVVTRIEECTDRYMFPDGYIIAVDIRTGEHMIEKRIIACLFDAADLISFEKPLAKHQSNILTHLQTVEILKWPKRRNVAGAAPVALPYPPPTSCTRTLFD